MSGAPSWVRPQKWGLPHPNPRAPPTPLGPHHPGPPTPLGPQNPGPLHPIGTPPIPIFGGSAAGGQEVSIRGWNLHEDFDIRGRAAWGVPEFYDYDVALVELEKEVGDTGAPR